jgi:dCTP deaminase
MTILSDKDIKSYMKSGKLEIEPFTEENMTPNGYDLTVEEILIPELKSHIDYGKVEVAGMRWFLISTKEYVKLNEEITAQLWIRTSWARKGIQSSFGRIDAGFKGTLTLSAFNASDNIVEIGIGDTFAQLVFERLNTPSEKSYEKRSGHYQGQRGVTLEGKTKKKES